MLYMINEYSNEYPDRPLQALSRFEDCSCNLHEMSLEELNEIVKTWKPLVSKTVKNYKSDLLHYLKWLQNHGIKTNLEIIREIEIPIKEERFLIYSTDDLHYYFDVLFRYLAKQEAHGKISFSQSVFYMTYSADILSFYGLTSEQIIALDLSDVQSNGLINYDLPLTSKDIEILLAYKYTNKINNIKLYGTKFIRSTRNQGKSINEGFLYRPIWRLEFDDETEYLQNLLRPKNLYLLGIYNRIYNKELETGDIIEKSKSSPDWLESFIDLTKTRSTLFKSEYLKYKAERIANNNLDNKIPVSQIDKEEKEKLLITREEILKQISKLNDKLRIIDALIKK